MSSASVRSLQFLSFIEPIFAWNVPLVSLIFLKRSHSVVFLYFFVLNAEEGFLIFPCYSLELCIQMGISFLFPLLFTSLLFTAICKASSDNHFAFLHLFSMLCSKFGKLSSGHRTGKGQFSFQSLRKAMPKNAQTTAQLHSSHMLVMLKILQARLQQYENHEIQMFKLLLEKAEESEIKLPTFAGSSKKKESSRKTSISALLTVPKPSTVWITINCGKFWRRWEYQTTWPASWETCMQVRNQQLELDIEQQTGSK